MNFEKFLRTTFLTITSGRLLLMKEWMGQTDPSKEASTFERMNGRQQLPFQIKRYTTLKNGRLQVAF